METIFFVQTSETGQILTLNSFPPQNEPHTAILSFSSILKYFHGNWLKTSLFG